MAFCGSKPGLNTVPITVALVGGDANVVCHILPTVTVPTVVAADTTALPYGDVAVPGATPNVMVTCVELVTVTWYCPFQPDGFMLYRVMYWPVDSP